MLSDIAIMVAKELLDATKPSNSHIISYFHISTQLSAKYWDLFFTNIVLSHYSSKNPSQMAQIAAPNWPLLPPMAPMALMAPLVPSKAPGTCPASWGPHRRRRRTVNLPRPPGARRRSPKGNSKTRTQRCTNSQ